MKRRLEDDLAGKKLVILGIARQGRALARYAVSVGAKVVVSDLRSEEQLRTDLESLEGLGIRFVLGEHPMNLLEGTDVLAISGGVPAGIPLVERAKEQGIMITNDSQEFIRRSPAACVGITGSAGKTTTTALTGTISQASGRKTWVGGNIGRPLIADIEKMESDDLVVQELSSFQLEIWQDSPPIAAVLNITPNHLDRHGTMDSYSQAKANILRYQRDIDVAVLSADDPGALALGPLVRGKLRLFSVQKEVHDGAFVRDGYVWLRSHQAGERAVCSLDMIRLRGKHNISNVCAAVTLADSAGIAIEAMQQAISEFRGVAHRLELVATINGVQFVNDSIATAPERALAALNSFDEPLILLAGGKDKNMVWENWAAEVNGRVKHVVLFGSLADLLHRKLTAAQGDTHSQAGISRAANLAEAVEIAAALAQPGDVVLLAPGGTSYDAYVDFEARGNEFRELVREHAADR